MPDPKVGGSAGNRGKGRRKGVPNKTTAAVKEALALAFEGVGGVAALQTWASANPTEFYKLWVKMLPQDVNAKVDGQVSVIQLVGVRPSGDR